MFNPLGTTWISKRLVSSALAVAALLTINTTAKAYLIAYEGFDYTPETSITNQNGGFGWGDSWYVAGGAEPASNYVHSLTYANGGSLFVTGNHLRSSYELDQYLNQSVRPQRELPYASTLSTYGSTVWVAFLVQNLNTTIGDALGFRESKLIFKRGSTTNASGWSGGNGSETLDVGTPNTYDTRYTDTYTLWNGSTVASSGVATVRGADQLGTAATLLVVRFDLDGTTAADTASLWVNPIIGPDGTDPGTPDAVYTGSQDFDVINGYTFQAGNKNGNATNASWNIDEFRIGTTYWDVAPAPEPSTIALMGIALSGLWLSIRRKRNS